MAAYAAMTGRKKLPMIAAILALTACSSQDASDPRVVAILSLSPPPAGWVSAYEDARYDFVPDGAKTPEVRGVLSQSELSVVRARVSELQFYRQSESEYAACRSSERGYTFSSKGNVVCAETGDGSGSAAQSAIDFLAEFYREKSGGP